MRVEKIKNQNDCSISFVGEEDIVWFEKTFRRMADEELGSNLGAHVQKNKYFVDFLRSLRDFKSYMARND